MNTMTLTIPGNPDAIQILRALKGAPLSCLGALRIAHPSLLGQKQLMFMTDYKKDAVTDAMTLLCTVYGFATRSARYNSWGLTTVGVQLKLPGLSDVFSPDASRALLEGDFSALPSSSSSSFLSLSNSESTEKTTTTTENESGKTALPKNEGPEPVSEEAKALIAKYLRGCQPVHGENAIRAALARGETLQDIEIQMIEWVTYGESPCGKGIIGPAVVAASKIKKGEKCPVFMHRINTDDPHTGRLWKEWLSVNEDWLERLDELNGVKPVPRPTITGKLARTWHSEEEALPVQP